MFDANAADRWGADPQFPASARHWTWCRDALPAVLQQAALAAGATAPVTVDIQALADAFWPWVELLDREQRFEAMDPVDFAHFASGMFLSRCLDTRPLKLPPAERAHEATALVDLSLTLLMAWRQALGASPLLLKERESHADWWASYVENMVEDHSQAVTLLDWISGLEPEGRLPEMLSERPAMLAALERQQLP